VQEGGGTVLVDERQLWPQGQFVTTHLIVRTEFLRDHPDVVENLLKGHVEANELVNAKPDEAKRVANEAIGKLTGKKFPPATVDGAWAKLTFTNDPIASSLRKAAADATELGLLEKADLDGIYDLGPLNRVLAASGKGDVKA